MTAVTIFGKGNMGAAIKGIATKAGASVQVIDSSTPAGTTVEGSIVVLAVPYPALASIAAGYASQLAGKTVVDITNPLDFSTFESLVPSDSSAAQQIAEQLPDSHVLKAFNTNFAATLQSGTVGDTSATTTVLIAGDDTDAKNALIALVHDGGLRAVDTCNLARARELEAVGYLQLSLAVNGKIGWTGGFSLNA